MQKVHYIASWFKDIVGLSLLLAVFYGVLLGHYPLGVPDESRYSEIPREMLATGDYTSPHLNGILYFEKPALFYWLQAGAIKLLGMNEWALRTVTALMAILGCLFTYSATRLLYDRKCAWLASAILATSLLYFAMGHLVTLDMTVACWLTGCLLSFILAIQSPLGKKRRLWMWTVFIFAALATLTKGLIGILFPSAIIGLWIAGTRQWHLIKNLYLPSGILLFLAISLPWHILIQLQHPEFAHFYVLDQQFLRFLTKAAGRYQPLWFFIPIVLIGFFPWVSFLWATVYFHSKNISDQRSLFWLIWVAFILIFFSISNSKLIPYILPIFPPLAIMLATYLKTQITTFHTLGMRINFILLPCFSLALASALIQIPYYHSTAAPELAKTILSALGVVLILGSLLSTGLFWRFGLPRALFSVIVMTILVEWLLLLAIPVLDTKSIKSLAIELRPWLKPNDLVVTYENYYQDLPVYLQRTVNIVAWTNELDFGSHLQNSPVIMLSRENFWKSWLSQRQVYMITDRATFIKLRKLGNLETCTILGQANDSILLSNHKATK